MADDEVENMADDEVENMADDEVSKKIDFAKDVLEHNNSLINLIDTKSGLVLGAAGIILGLLSFFDRNGLDQYTLYALFATMILLGATILFSFIVIFPRTTKKEKGETVIFYSSIIKNTLKEYTESFKKLKTEDILNDYTNNIYSLAKVQERKFKFLRWTLGLMMISVVSLVVTLICYLKPQ